MLCALELYLILLLYRLVIITGLPDSDWAGGIYKLNLGGNLFYFILVVLVRRCLVVFPCSLVVVVVVKYFNRYFIILLKCI